MNDIIKWGIIGLGNVAHQFARSFYNIKNAKLVAIASKTQNKLSRFKDEFKINEQNCHDNYQKLLNNNEVDIIYIALPNSLHHEWIYKAIELNKHILVEKPAFTNFQETQKVFSHPNYKKFFLAEGFMYRYHPQIKKIIELIDNNEIGKITSMECFFGKNLINKKKLFGLFNSNKFDSKKRIFNKSLGGGAILDHGSYTVSMSLLIASLINGLNLKNFTMTENKKKMIENIDVESSVELIFDEKFKSNITASFLNDIGNKTIINGEDGKIVIFNTWNSETGEIELENDKKKSFKIENKQNLYSREIERISEDILNNKTEASYPGTKKNEIFISSQILDRWLNE
jgi:predicted dehydrogenase|tara:strand:+ start:956 stop:1984 length:1029 start_codon:yes stop_codon:yes gene_type:complete